ncbi:hypothetical protein QZH41_014825, partial [Actinostola sp. cb2023]
FEDGTLPFLDIIGVGHGLNNLHQLTGGMHAICKHTFSLSQFVYKKMDSMRHSNGARVCELYCGTTFNDHKEQGPIINFNLLRSDGTVIGYGEVDKFACLFNIHLRTGSFCNTGASQAHLGISNTQLKSNYAAGHVCGDDVDLIDGQPTGSVRISFGYMSTFSDAQRFLKFIRSCFIENVNAVAQRTELVAKQNGSTKSESDSLSLEQNVDVSAAGSTESPCVYSHGQTSADNEQQDSFTLKKIFLYPIKSCGAFEVAKWQIGPRGFMCDRQWMVINESHICLSQKREPKLCLIRPFIEEGIMMVDAPGW